MGEICREPAIVIRNLYKEYKLGETNARSLQGEIREKWQKRRGKLPPDPLQNEEGGKRFLALNDINLTVYKGEMVGIIGKNGSGKSTLLKLISRITAPTRGRIDIYGRVTSMLEVGTGFNGDMTGRENIYLNGAILGMTQAEIDRKLKDIIAFSEVEKFIDTPVKRYSSGMYVKLGFSVAAHLTSDIMIMDEVLAVGDMAYQKKCLDCMRRAAMEEGRTVLYVSHNMETVKRLCDRCIVLDSGRIVHDGDVDQAVAIYLGQIKQGQAHFSFDDSQRVFDMESTARELSLLSLDLQDGDQGGIVSDKAVRMMLTLRAEKDLEQVYFRFQILAQDGTRAGSMQTAAGTDLPAGENMVLFTVDPSHLVNGQYQVDVIAYQWDAQGNEKILDAVYSGFFFSIRGSGQSEKEQLNWRQQYLGNIRLHDLQVEKTEQV